MSAPAIPHVTVCICTFRRATLLQRLLQELRRQHTDSRFTYSIVVADNDAARSSESVVAAWRKESSIEVTYCCEPRQNIALARNKALEHATGDYIAFIDDDEFPAPDWLLKMLDTCEHYRVAGVLGPVRPHFEESPPSWVVKGRFCERPEHPTGRVMDWEESRTGNLLFRRDIIAGIAEPFDPQFGTGGEDMDFFRRSGEAGHVFVWCNDAAAYESVPCARLTRTYMLRRALLRGKNILKHSSSRARFILTSLAAVPLYLVVLPLCLFAGQHHFMKYCIKLCDHGGRLLSIVGLNPIDSRDL